MNLLFLFAPGAGAPSTHPWMQKWKQLLSPLGRVETFDYDYMREGRKRPDPLAQLIAAHRRALAHATETGNESIFLIGKSMGGRVGCHVALEERVAGVICLGYPLQSGATGAMRDEVLLALRTPILFVQGSRDSLCPVDKLAAVRARMTAPSTLLVVEGGNHSLEVSAAQRKASGITQAAADARVLDAIRAFVESAPASG